jgi:hypothetical protein
VCTEISHAKSRIPTFCNDRRTVSQRLYEVSVGTQKFRVYGSTPIQALSLFSRKTGVTSIVGLEMYWIAGHDRMQVL